MDNGIADKSSIYNYYVRIEELAREYQIGVESQLLAGQKLAECNRREGVNQFVNCRDLALKYKALCEDQYHGMIFPESAKEINRKRIFSISGDSK